MRYFVSAHCVLVLASTVACSGINKTDRRGQSSGADRAALDLNAAAATASQTASTTSTSIATPSNPTYCPPDQSTLPLFGSATNGLVAQYAALRDIQASDFGGYRIKAMNEVTSAQAAIVAAITYIEVTGDCDKTPPPPPPKPQTNPLKLPANPGDFGKTLLAVGDQLTAIANTLNVSIAERDFGGHRAQAASDVALALADLQTAIDFEACEEIPARTFVGVAASLTAVGKALSGIAQGDFGGWKVKAIADVGAAVAMVTKSAAVTQSECAKPDQSTAAPFADPLKLPTQPGIATQVIVTQADALTAVVNQLNVTITERDFNGLRAAAAADVLIVLNDLQNAVIYEACQEGSKDAACALVKPAL